MNSPRTSSKLFLFLFIVFIVKLLLLATHTQTKNAKKFKCQNMQKMEIQIMQFPSARLSQSITLNPNVQNYTIQIPYTYSDVRHFCTLIDSVNPFENLFFKCCVEPRHLNSPFTIIASRVQSASHSSMLCDVRTIDFPELRIFVTIFHRLRFAPGSIPVVGSSARNE